MFEKIRAWLKKFSSTEGQPYSSPETTSSEPSDQQQQSPNTRPLDLALTLTRTTQNAEEIHGEIKWLGHVMGVTIESVSDRIPAGLYPIELRPDGGKHATYQMRYQDLHQGMLHITDVPGVPYVYLCAGPNALHAGSDIMVGTQIESVSAEGTASFAPGYETAYRYLYQTVLDQLELGNHISLEIREPESFGPAGV
ncbi:DUF5675 family protein [Pontibacter sp. G13]|uniref:DUF5675 family protein n=1 Tax=Pontibacter sp. G13 TaxID=3074898 RepID=UPI00288A95B0|nr:DUF5675 family protein [Pontibacter sp. G13]WNJ17254.1 DUF5675 family protein [Pontibacter sp. G13]